MTEWRYIAQRITGDGSEGKFLHFYVPLRDVQITDVLSGPLSMSATISPEDGRMLADDGRPLFDEWGTALWAEADGQIRGGGILTHSTFEGASWALETTGYAGYAAGLPYTGDRQWIQTDPLVIYRHIWSHIQNQTNGDLNLEIDNTTSRVRIGDDPKDVKFTTSGGEDVEFEAGPYKLNWFSTTDLGDELDKLAETTPFDYHEEHDWDGEIIRHRLRLFHPAMGRRRNDLRFVIGENVSVLPSIERNGESYASEVMALGAGEGRKMVKAIETRKTDRLRRVAIVTDKSARTKRRAAKKARAELAWRQILDDISQIQVRDHPHAPTGSFAVGDEIYLSGDAGWIDVGLWFRVLSLTVSPDAGESMTLDVVRSDKTEEDSA